MEQANIPSQAELSSLYGSWNPMGYARGMQNLDLADQFRDQSFMANQQALKTKALENDQSQLMNPLLVTEKQLSNTGKSLNNDNQSLVNKGLGLDVDTKSQLHDDSIAAEREALRTKLGDEKFNQVSMEILRDHMNNIKEGDPTKIAQTGELLKYLTGPTASKAADRAQTRDLSELQRMTQQNIATGNNAATVRAAEIGANSREAVANTHAANALKAKELSQNIQQRLSWLSSQPKTPENIAQYKQLEKTLTQANAAYANAVDLYKATGGSVGRQGDRETSSMSDEDLINKYNKK